LNIGGPPSKSKYIKKSIVNKYREGKMKRPCKGVWNRSWNLKLDAIVVLIF